MDLGEPIREIEIVPNEEPVPRPHREAPAPDREPVHQPEREPVPA